MYVNIKYVVVSRCTNKSIRDASRWEKIRRHSSWIPPSVRKPDWLNLVDWSTSLRIKVSGESNVYKYNLYFVNATEFRLLLLVLIWSVRNTKCFLFLSHPPSPDLAHVWKMQIGPLLGRCILASLDPDLWLRVLIHQHSQEYNDLF